MIWNRKFNYPRSTRSVINGSRHYSVAQHQLPSVTAILSLTKSEEDKAALSAWKKRIAPVGSGVTLDFTNRGLREQICHSRNTARKTRFYATVSYNFKKKNTISHFTETKFVPQIAFRTETTKSIIPGRTKQVSLS